jgi:hypothetical protein
MSGSPLVRAAVALAVLLLLLVPLWSFTGVRTAAPMAERAAQAETSAHLEIVSTKWPFTFSVSHLGKIIWSGSSSAASIEKDVSLPIPKEGVDLLLKMNWAGSETAAAKLILTHDDGEPVERTLWGAGTASDVLTFP